MWSYILRRLLYSIPVYLGILLLVMLALRVNDPVAAYLGKNPDKQTAELKRKEMGLDKPFVVQYAEFVGRVATLNFGTKTDRYESWRFEGQNVGKKLRESIIPSLSITIPNLVLTTIISIGVGLVSAYFRGSLVDRTLMVLVVLGMSVSVVAFIVIGQSLGSTGLRELTGREIFASSGYEPVSPWIESGKGSIFSPSNWARYCMLPVLIGVVVAIGYDTRFYRAVMVEETTRDYITTAVAKGATKPKIMLVHMLKNAMIPIITRIMITVPFLIGGSILLETQFRIPGMGKLLIDSVTNKDFPMIQTFTAVFAGVFLLTNILTDICYALVDPRVRLA